MAAIAAQKNLKIIFCVFMAKMHLKSFFCIRKFIGLLTTMIVVGTENWLRCTTC